MTTFSLFTSGTSHRFFNLAVVILVILCSSSIAVAESPPISNTFLHSRQISYTNQTATGNNKTEIVNKIRGTTISGALTITRCRGDGQLQLLGIWMVLTSGASSVAAMLGHGRWMFAGRSREVEATSAYVMSPSTVAYDPNGHEPPAPDYYPAEVRANPGYNIQPQQYYNQPKPYPLTAYYSAPQYEPVNLRGGAGNRGFFSRDITDFRQEGNKYGQWISWGLIISLWLVGCALGFIGSVGIARRVWDTIGKVREITKWFFMPAAVMMGLTILLCLCSGRKKADGTYEHSEDELRPIWKMMKWTSKICLWLLVFMLVYMDWLLAAVTDNWSGIPSKLDKGGKILYWVYFVCKRFALLWLDPLGRHRITLCEACNHT